MTPRIHLFTSESVTEGHPDKVADQVSDAVLDAMIGEDEVARVACETLVTTGLVLVAGEVTTEAYVHLPDVVRETLREIGYDDPELGFDCDSCAVLTSIDKQSQDIALGVDSGGAGDQGMMFGYATDETDTLMPLPISLAHRLTRRLSEVRKHGLLDWLRPDGKSQVTVEYEDETPRRITTVVISAQHHPDIGRAELEEELQRTVIEPVLPAGMCEQAMRCYMNPTGRFVVGGPQGDAGVTGRKVIVDTYGGVGSHGGGAFSGKDPTKVDRSASYAARWVAKNLVAAGLARRIEIQLAYAIGVAEPISIMLNSYGSGVVPDEELERCVGEVFDLRPVQIIKQLRLRRPIFRRTAAYGHFGREPDEEGGFSWEVTDKVDDLKGFFA
ncbi:MAG: methionine adenosyltransferase [Gemmatimonadota bacterium]|nr:methionine adenosyltransferase [Gemmatimonadota bacterium]